MEIWKDIKGFEGLYQVSTYGRIKSFKSPNGKPIGKSYEKILNPGKNANGNKYTGFLLRNDIEKIPAYLHRLVAETFIPNPLNKPDVNHKDCNKRNNSVDNLEWVTKSENMIHAYKNNLVTITDKTGNKNGKSKLTDSDVIGIKKLLSNNVRCSDIAKLYNVAHSTIQNIKHKRNWTHI